MFVDAAAAPLALCFVCAISDDRFNKFAVYISGSDIERDDVNNSKYNSNMGNVNAQQQLYS